MSLYTDLIEAGIKVDNHESDLYCPVTYETIALMRKHKLQPSIFIHEVEKTKWFDVPFMFDPWWEKRGCKV